VTQRKRPAQQQHALAAQRARTMRFERRRRTRQTVIMLIIVITLAAMVLATV